MKEVKVELEKLLEKLEEIEKQVISEIEPLLTPATSELFSYKGIQPVRFYNFSAITFRGKLIPPSVEDIAKRRDIKENSLWFMDLDILLEFTQLIPEYRQFIEEKKKDLIRIIENALKTLSEGGENNA